MTALHSCPHCSRHPATHGPAGDDRCGACGLGDAIETGRAPVTNPISSHGLPALHRAIVDEERAEEFETRLTAAGRTLDAAETRLRALEALAGSVAAVERAAGDLDPADAHLVTISSPRLPPALAAARAEVVRLERVVATAQAEFHAFEDVAEDEPTQESTAPPPTTKLST